MSRTAATAILILMFVANAAADVAPDPGYARVPANLVLESDADLSGYRFFLESAMDVEEVRVSSGAPTVIEASGRGGAARYAKLIAVPSSDMRQLSGDLSAELIGSMIREKRFPNAVVLLSHSFQATVPQWEKEGWADPVYRIAFDEGGKISATPIAGGRPSGTRLTYSVWRFVWPVAVAGLLLAAGIAVTGVWLFRRRARSREV
jgi:hypothetical protein